MKFYKLGNTSVSRIGIPCCVGEKQTGQLMTAKYQKLQQAIEIIQTYTSVLGMLI